jgi:hypothetical protein
VTVFTMHILISLKQFHALLLLAVVASFHFLSLLAYYCFINFVHVYFCLCVRCTICYDFVAFSNLQTILLDSHQLLITFSFESFDYRFVLYLIHPPRKSYIFY